MIESFWSTMQRALLDTRSWEAPEELGAAIFDGIDAWYRSRRRTALGMLSSVDYETQWRRQQNSVPALLTAAKGAA